MDVGREWVLSRGGGSGRVCLRKNREIRGGVE